MQQTQTDQVTIASLLATAKDESKSTDERYGAMRLACSLRGDEYAHVPIEQLRFVAAALDFSHILQGAALSFRGAAEAVAAGFARRSAPVLRR